jgi:hypothetical protein
MENKKIISSSIDSKNIFFLKNSRVLITLLVTSLIFLNTLGFDLYAHAIWYSDGNEVIAHFRSYELFGIKLPRYLLLSYIYEITAQYKIPLGWVAFLLQLLANYNLLVKSDLIKLAPMNINEMVKRIVILNVIFYLNVTYSAASLSLLWALSYKLRPKKIFILGAFFHPIGFITFLIINNRKNTMLYIFIVAIITIFLSIYGDFYSTNTARLMSVVNSKGVTYSLIVAKSEYVYILILLMAAAYLTRKSFITNVINRKNVKFIFILNFFLIFSLVSFLSFYVSGNFLMYFFSFDFHPVILHTWFPGFFIEDFNYLLDMRSK